MSLVRPSQSIPVGVVDLLPLEELVQKTFDSELNATPMPGGASTRKYFRVALPHDKSAVAMFVPGGGKPEEVQIHHAGERWPFLEVRDLLAERGIDVPSVLAEDTPNGWLVIQDLGDDTLANWLLRNPGDKPALYTNAVTALAKAKRVADLPKGFVHRDYQSRNLMVVDDGTLRLVWIDFQDALLGPRVYDLVALLNDSYQEFDRAFVEARLGDYAEAAGLPAKDRTKLLGEFDLVTVQRKLKDAGRFVFIDRTKKNSSFLRFVTPTIKKVDAALARLAPKDPEMAELRAILQRTLGDELTAA